MNRRTSFRLAAAALACAGAASAAADGGTVAGKVEATPAKYLQDTVVYLKKVPGTWAPKTLSMDQRGMKFLPRVLPITQGDTVRFLNNDGVAHNVYSPDGESYNLGTFKQGEEAKYTYQKTGAYSQLCSIHPEMLAYVFVGQNPYSAAVDAHGHYEIKGVPPGSYTIAVWNASKLKAAERSVTVTAGKTTAADLSIQR
jgi:plastocyanin